MDIRVDAVNSIIRLDFSRKEGEWEPNEYGGNENIEAIDFLKELKQYHYTAIFRIRKPLPKKHPTGRA